MISLRCSRLPILFACPSSHSPWKHPIESDSPAAVLGRKVHDVLAKHISGQPYEMPEGEAGDLVAAGLKMWPQLTALNPLPVSAGTPLWVTWSLSGTPDIVSLGRVMDWKSGWKDMDYTPQMWGYGYLVGSSEAIVIWLRFRAYDIVPIPSRAEVVATIDEKVEKIGKAWNPGEHCGYCHGKLECAAYEEYRSHCVNALTEWKAQQPVTAEQLASLVPQAVALKKVLEEFESYKRSWVDQHGALPLGDGYQLEFGERHLEAIDAKMAWGAIVEEVGLDEMGSLVKIGKQALEKAVKAKAPKGEKAEVWRQFMRALREAGATSETISRQLRKVKVK